MMNFIYMLRVLVVSLEAVVLLLGLLAWTYLDVSLNKLASALSINEDALKFLMLVPLGLFVWIANELRQLLVEDKDTIRILTDWPDYSLLKVHVWVALLYSVVFASLSVVPWFAPSGVRAGWALLIFVASTLGQLLVAASVYSARIKVKELVAHVRAPSEETPLRR